MNPESNQLAPSSPLGQRKPRWIFVWLALGVGLALLAHRFITVRAKYENWSPTSGPRVSVQNPPGHPSSGAWRAELVSGPSSPVAFFPDAQRQTHGLLDTYSVGQVRANAQVGDQAVLVTANAKAYSRTMLVWPEWNSVQFSREISINILPDGTLYMSAEGPTSAANGTAWAAIDVTGHYLPNGWLVVAATLHEANWDGQVGLAQTYQWTFKAVPTALVAAN